MPHPRIIEIHPDAPPKPAVGESCNGCGVCCLAEPCPLGMLLSRRLRGACVALRWEGGRYVCGALGAKPRGLRGWLVRRWIGAGQGCDCSLEPQPPEG
ncbi:hypothetical protein QRD43_09825 [Pelomonas sp. APW6]|uniref:4Fe-4S ferredoxin-type domain-containing protein n=1 Tax=Roseateles subflavus TaxID=3053353 RepID=A0ABT7LIT1_9BURK|nr:hypothetical protein [Pelomonas sp. APW6]MDL5032202.1 hypothetical protein [Pelomonas sp. APW6]